MMEIGKGTIDTNPHLMAIHMEDRDIHLSELNRIIKNKLIYPLYQPIFDIRTNNIFGYEALTRAPQDSPLHLPEPLFQVASEHQLLFELECVCREEAISNFSNLGLRGKLFLNVDPQCLMDPDFHEGITLNLLQQSHMQGSQVIIELTEHTHVDDMPKLKQAVEHYRKMGFSIALDDLSAGYSNLQLMAELRPEYIKLDKYFVRQLPESKVAQEFVRTIVNLSKHIDCAIVAEGIETAQVLCEARKLGLHLGQGYFLGMPERHPIISVTGLHETNCNPRSNCSGHACITNLLVNIPPCHINDLSEKVLARFQNDHKLLALPVVDENRTIGIVLREEILMHFSMPFTRELHGRKPIRQIMQNDPLIVPANTPIETLSELTTNRPFSHLYAPVIVENREGYAGLIFVHDLLENITRMKVDQAMDSNPLTRLPGNAAIEREMERRLNGTDSFILCYIDLDNFKAFNDYYGYKRGDAMIRLVADIMRENKRTSDFIGHIGGDDFIIMCGDHDEWENSLQNLLSKFALRVRELYDVRDIGAGGIRTKNRIGETCHFPLASLSIGALSCPPGIFSSHLEAAEIATELKKKAKKTVGNCLEIDRRERHMSGPDAMQTAVTSLS